MTSDNQTCAEFEPPTDWPHLALSVRGWEETNFDLPTEEERLDEICAKKPEYVVLQYTTIDIETVPGSSKETIEAIEYQEKWETDVVGWFKKSNYEPVGYKTLDSEPVFDCEHGIERFAAYGRLDHKIYAWNMRQELKDSPATLSRHHWVFELFTFCMACDRHFHHAQQHDCNRKCTLRVGETQCGKTVHGDLNLRRHQTSHDDYTSRGHDWSGQEVRVAYNLHLLGYTVDDISKEIPWRSKMALKAVIKSPMYGCQVCHKVFRKSFTLQSHSKKVHDAIQTQHYCYKCGEVHELEGWGACLGKQHRLDLGDQAEMNAFYDMQLMFLTQHDSSDSPGLGLMVDVAHMERSKCLSALCTHLRNRGGRWNITSGIDNLIQAMIAQLLRVAQCEEEFVSQGKGDRVIDVSSGNLEWYRKLRPKACEGDGRPRLSATEMGLSV